MPIRNPTEFLINFTQYPAAIEANLPVGAPKISATLADIASKLPMLPDFPVELPDLPVAPTPFMMPPMGAGLRQYVAGVEVRPVQPIVARRPLEEEILS